MPREIAFFDALIPALAVLFVLSGIAQLIVDQLFSRLRLYRFVWHPSLFRVALFFIIFSSSGLFYLGRR